MAQASVEFKQDKTVSKPRSADMEFTVFVISQARGAFDPAPENPGMGQALDVGGPSETLRRDRIRKMLGVKE